MKKFQGVRAYCRPCGMKSVQVKRYGLDGIEYRRCRVHPRTPLVIVSSSRVVEGWKYTTLTPVPAIDPEPLVSVPEYENPRPQRPEWAIVGFCPLCRRRARVRVSAYRRHYFCRVHPNQDLVMVDTVNKVAWIGRGWSSGRGEKRVEYKMHGEYHRGSQPERRMLRKEAMEEARARR